MSISVEFTGDVDRLPHKDLAERIVKAINDAVRETCEKAGMSASQSEGWAERTMVASRPFLGSTPYAEASEYVHATAGWGVHLPDPVPDPVAEAPEIDEKS